MWQFWHASRTTHFISRRPLYDRQHTHCIRAVDSLFRQHPAQQLAHTAPDGQRPGVPDASDNVRRPS